MIIRFFLSDGQQLLLIIEPYVGNSHKTTIIGACVVYC